jgi:hypothetical protein
MKLKRFSELNAKIDVETNQLYTQEPFETFLGAPCELLGRKEVTETVANKEVTNTYFVHNFSPSEFQEGTAVDYTDLEYIEESKPTQDLSCKAWSALAFNRSENRIVSISGWSVWKSDSGKKERWLTKLKNEFSNVPMIN